MGVARGRWTTMAVLVVGVCMVATACTPQPSARVEQIAVAPELGEPDHSWAWSIVPGTAKAAPLLVGLDRRGTATPTLQILTVRDGARPVRLQGLPQTPGFPVSVMGLRRGAGAVVIGAAAEGDGTPRVFLLESVDGERWSPLPLSEPVDIVPAAAAATEDAVYFGREDRIFRVDGVGGTTRVQLPPLERGEVLLDLAADASTLWLVTRRTDELRAYRSHDSGANWEAAGTPGAGSGQRVVLSGSLAVGGQLFLAGSCASVGQRGRACLLVPQPDGWVIETPFSDTGGPATRMIGPALGADGSILASSTMPNMSEGWLAQRSQAGQWTGNRADIVGAEIGVVQAVGAGQGGQGIVSVVSSTEVTEMVWRNDAAGDGKGDRRFTLGGTGIGSWIRSVGRSWSPRSQLLEVRATVVNAPSGAYFSVKKATPVGLADDGSLQRFEWRPAQARGMDAFLAETVDGVTVLAGSEPVQNATSLGQVHVFATKPDGTWSDVATNLADRLRGQMAMSLAHVGDTWLVGTGSPISDTAAEPARLFASTDGHSWREVPAPSDAGHIDHLCGIGADGVLALGSTDDLDRAWQRSAAGVWSPVTIPEGVTGKGCIGTSSGTIMIGGHADGGSVWKLNQGRLDAVDAGLPAGAELFNVLPLDGGMVVTGVVRRDGASTARAWISRDGQVWNPVHVGVLAGDAFLTAVTRSREVIVVATASDGLHAWKVVPTW